jgi:hypothetical protein
MEQQLPPLQTGEVVRVAPKPGDRDRKWFKAGVKDRVDIRSYEARTEDGKLYKRNRRHLRRSKEPFGQSSEASSVAPSQDNQSNTWFTTAEPVRPQATGQPVQGNFLVNPSQQNLWQFSQTESHY